MSIVIKILNNIGYLALIAALVIITNLFFDFKINVKGYFIPKDIMLAVYFAVAGMVIIGISKILGRFR
ncbi:MAG: hypothetical protein JW917_05925 [Ignavibacteria bacterium]|nr:hypothetical protein [Ignavibacteria bacterium]